MPILTHAGLGQQFSALGPFLTSCCEVSVQSFPPQDESSSTPNLHLGGRCGVHVGSHWWQSCCIPNAFFWLHTLDTNLTRSLGAGVAHPGHQEPGFAVLVGNGNSLPELHLALNAF